MQAMKLLSVIVFSLCFSLSSLSQTPEEYYKQGNEKYKEKKFQEAIKLYGKAIDKMKDSCKYYVARGDAYAELGKFQQALDDFGTAIYVKSTYYPAYQSRSYVLQKVGMFEESIKDNNMVIMLAPNDTIKKNGYLNNGVNRALMRDFEGAYTDYMKALKFDSLDPNIYN